MIETKNLFGNLPETLRKELTGEYLKIERNFRENRWEPAELNGGKLCEIVYSILKGHVDGQFPAKSSKPPNMVDACRRLEQSGQSFPRSIRIQIPRMLMSLYEIRNNRGVGHVGGDVNPNRMDALCVLKMSKWILAELARVFHNMSTNEAANIVDKISERTISVIWQIGDVKRVLQPSMNMLNKTMLLLYSSIDGLFESDLLKFLEHSNASVYRRDILKKAHKNCLIEYNKATKLSILSPLGVNFVEERILPSIDLT